MTYQPSWGLKGICLWREGKGPLRCCWEVVQTAPGRQMSVFTHIDGSVEEMRWPKNSGAYRGLEEPRSRRASILFGTVLGKWFPTLVLVNVANGDLNRSMTRGNRLLNVLWGMWSYEKGLRQVQRRGLLYTSWCGRFWDSEREWQGRMVKSKRHQAVLVHACKCRGQHICFIRPSCFTPASFIAISPCFSPFLSTVVLQI